ncbi:synaptobrevin, longin-like domain protein [Tanacetum coccineum]
MPHGLTNGSYLYYSRSSPHLLVLCFLCEREQRCACYVSEKPKAISAFNFHLCFFGFIIAIEFDWEVWDFQLGKVCVIKYIPSTNKAWCDDFEVLMKGEFEMSAMGELTFFLGLQVKQKPDGIFISQDKYVQDMLKKFDMESITCRFLMYLTASRPVIQFAKVDFMAVQKANHCGYFPLKLICCCAKLLLVGICGPRFISSGSPLGCLNPRMPWVGVDLSFKGDDDGGVEDLPIADIYLGMDNLGYPTEGKLTFHKNKFSPQWRFLVHTILHCLSTKSGSWDQFGSQVAIALICLTEGRRYNWSSYIFKGMVNNINNPKKFLMFPRFLQMILEIEPKITKQYHAFKLTSKMFANMRLNFQGDHMPLLGTMLPPAQAAIAGESSGEAAPSNPQTVPETITEPDHSHDHESTPPRPTTTTSSALVNEQGPSSDPNIASSSRPHESAPDLFTSTNVEDETMGGSFHTSPPRSTQAPPEGTTSGGAEDLDKLTALSSLVSTLVQKVNTQESELKAHKLLFKEVVGKLVKKVKLLEDKLKGRKRKFVMTDSDKEEDAEQDVDPLIKLAKAAATAAAASAILWWSHVADIPTSSSILLKKTSVRERTFRQREEDRLGEEAARRMYEEEQDELEREREEMQRKRQQDVLNSAKYYTDSDWTDIMGQVHANQGLTADLLGPDVNEDNTLLEDAPILSAPDESQQPSAEVPPTATQHSSEFSSQPTVPSAEPRTHSYGTRRKSLGARKKSSTELDLTADDRSFIRVLSDDSDDSNDDDDPPNFWPAFAAWEVIPTGLGDVNALYFMDKSSKYFTHLREILHLVDRKDLFKLYGMVVPYYEEHPLAGNGMILWGDLQVLFESHEGGTGAGVWADQQQWVIRSWRSLLILFQSTHVENVKAQLEVEIDGIGNDMTYAEQLIQFIKNQLLLSFLLLIWHQDYQVDVWFQFPGYPNDGFTCHILGMKSGLSKRLCWSCCGPLIDADFLVADSKFMKVAFGVGFKIIAVPSSVTTSRYVVPTGRVKVPASRRKDLSRAGPTPTTESPGYVVESDPEEYEGDETEDGPVEYPMDGGEDRDDDDEGSSHRDDADDEDEDEENEDEDDEEEKEEQLALANSAVVVPTVELASISLPPETEVKRLLAMPTPPLSPPISLSPPSTGERLARCTVLSAHSSPPPVPSLLLPSFGYLTQIQTLRITSTQAFVDAVTAALPSPLLLPLPPSLYIPPPVDRRDDILESKQPPRKRPTGGRGVDYGFVSTLDAKERRRGIREVGYGIRDTWVDPTEAVPEIAPMTMGEMQQAEMAELREIDRRCQAQIVETLCVMSDKRGEMDDMQAELLALREQQRRARQPRPDVRVPDH